MLDQTDTPHLKVRMVDANGGKVGSLLSADLEGVEVPEPSTFALLGVGCVGVYLGRRREKNRR